ncbi:MAG: hypothetical protein PUB22_02780 [Clostridiales bacterium]|nr:hypothetical protein [Clostridiales bacterium]
MFGKILMVILIIVLIALVVLYFAGNRMQKKQIQAEQQMEAMKQTASILVIDKKIMKLKESGLPETVINETPWYAKRSKMPIVKAKVGPRIMVLVADRAVWDVIPVKSEVKVEISGIYITAIKSVRGGSVKAAPRKQGFLLRMRNKLSGSLKKNS